MLAAGIWSRACVVQTSQVHKLSRYTNFRTSNAPFMLYRPRSMSQLVQTKNNKIVVTDAIELIFIDLEETKQTTHEAAVCFWNKNKGARGEYYAEFVSMSREPRWRMFCVAFVF